MSERLKSFCAQLQVTSVLPSLSSRFDGAPVRKRRSEDSMAVGEKVDSALFSHLRKWLKSLCRCSFSIWEQHARPGDVQLFDVCPRSSSGRK